MNTVVDFLKNNIIEIAALIISLLSSVHTIWSKSKAESNRKKDLEIAKEKDLKIERQVISNSDLRRLYKFNNDENETEKIFNDVSRIMYYSGKVYDTELYYDHLFKLTNGKSLYIRLINLECVNNTVSKFIEEALDEAKNARKNILDETIIKKIDYYVECLNKIQFRNKGSLDPVPEYNVISFAVYSELKKNVQFNKLYSEEKESIELIIGNKMGVNDIQKLVCYSEIMDTEVENNKMFNILNMFIEENFFYVNR